MILLCTKKKLVPNSRFLNLLGHLMETLKFKFNISIDRRRHSDIPNVRSFSTADCDTDHYLELGKVRERLAVSKQEQYRVEI
jgi:uncharacterized protein YlxP (DUF503 family)